METTILKEVVEYTLNTSEESEVDERWGNV